jgi:hypothetical protein
MKKYLPRRTFVKGFGTAIALPFLDAMVPALATAAERPAPPRRMAFIYVPNGVHMADWTPKRAGGDFDLPRILQPLAPFRKDLLVLTGLAQLTGSPYGEKEGDHVRAGGAYLTGVRPKKTQGVDIALGVSADQVAAQQIGGRTRFPSLELSCEDSRLGGFCEPSYSCAYLNSLSWRSATTPNPPEINPRAVFERLFAGMEPGETAASRARRALERRSILDFALEDAGRISGRLGPTDRRKVDEYLTAVRAIELRIEAAERDEREANEGLPARPSMDKPAGVPTELREHIDLMFDLTRVAFQCDLTRIVTFIVGREGSGLTFREIGISDAHHPLTHHRGNPEMIEKVIQINRWHVDRFVRFLESMRAAAEGDGTLLDHSMVLYGSGLSDGDKHLHYDLPLLLAGRGGGSLKPGRHVVYKPETPMNNLLLAMLERMHVPAETLGDSTGKLDQLSEL